LKIEDLPDEQEAGDQANRTSYGRKRHREKKTFKDKFDRLNALIKM